jgi:hypothetical protein
MNRFQAVLDRQREFFFSGASRSHAWRMDQLGRMERLLRESLQALSDALLEATGNRGVVHNAMYGTEPQQSPDFARMISTHDTECVASSMLPDKVVHGGRYDVADRHVGPTVLHPSTWDDPAMPQEVFGPVLPVLHYDFDATPRPCSWATPTRCSMCSRPTRARTSRRTCRSFRSEHMRISTRRRWLAAAAALPLGAALPGCASSGATPPGPGMKASTTYLHLLAKVPMFRGMSSEQLQWVIDHSREWSVEPGAEVASSQRGVASFWTLLDGGWRLEVSGRAIDASHADPAKWYGGRDMAALALPPTRLVATRSSYVMEIAQPELDEMLRRGLPLAPHLRAGLDFYRTLVR